MTVLPTQTHTGVLNLLGIDVRVYRLSDGRTVFNAEDTHAVLEAMLGGEELPADLTAQIQKLLDESLVPFEEPSA